MGSSKHSTGRGLCWRGSGSGGRLLLGGAAYLLCVLTWAPCGRGAIAASDETRIGAGVRTLPVAPLGRPNRWPRFRFQIPSKPIAVPSGLSGEDLAGMFTNAVVPPLPYLMQDNYSRRREPAEVPVIEVENAFLKAVFYPSLGGRMISLYDKREGRELLFDNPVLQFANLAIRNAWFSGGVEWNGPLYGHSLLTCSPVFVGIVETERGPILRIYEFDRALETAWQVDIYAPREDGRLWVHVKAANPNPKDIEFYWWTNIAVPMSRETRVLSPLDYALSHDFSGNSRLEFPFFDGFDGSRPFLYPYFKSVFFRKPASEKPWSVCVDGKGAGIAHVSTATLFGRKFFTWGTGRGGRRWMEFLSEEGKGEYIEIQGGVTPTQLQTRPLGAGGSIEWTECIAAFAMDGAMAQQADYLAACAAAGEAIDKKVPADALRDADAFLKGHATTPITTLLHRGTGWGELFERRTGARISAGLLFEDAPGGEEQPWSELLADGTFSAATLGREPESFNVSPGWMDVLRRSMKERGATWLHHLHAGVAALEAGSFEEAKRDFGAALELKESALGRRCVALLEEQAGRLDSAFKAYEGAWRLCADDTNLAVEICEFLARHNRADDLGAFVNSLPPAIAAHERITLAQAQMALERGEYESVRHHLNREFTTVREGEVSLSDLWFASFIREAEGRKGRKLTDEEARKISEDNPPPRQIDFRMK